jgi:hypothetical protein
MLLIKNRRLFYRNSKRVLIFLTNKFFYYYFHWLNHIFKGLINQGLITGIVDLNFVMDRMLTRLRESQKLSSSLDLIFATPDKRLDNSF